MRIKTIRNKIYKHLKQKHPELTFVKFAGNTIFVYSIHTAIVSNKIDEITIAPSGVSDHFLAFFGENYTHTLRFTYSRKNGFKMLDIT